MWNDLDVSSELEKLTSLERIADGKTVKHYKR